MQNGKGDTQRPGDQEKYEKGWDSIFGKKYIEEMGQEIDKACLKTMRFGILGQIGLSSFALKLILVTLVIALIKLLG